MRKSCQNRKNVLHLKRDRGRQGISRAFGRARAAFAPSNRQDYQYREVFMDFKKYIAARLQAGELTKDEICAMLAQPHNS